MLMKIAVLIFIIFTIKGFMNLFKGNESWNKSMQPWKDMIDKSGLGVTFATVLILTIVFDIYYILLYYNIGKVNELMMWLSASQIIFCIVNSFKTINIISQIAEGKNPKRTNWLIRFGTVVFNTFYISLAIMYMYLV